MGKIFISYRRSDSKTAATYLYRELVKKFGDKNIFFDVDAIDGGQNFSQAIASFITQSDVLLAVIGQEWLDVEDANGNRRLDDPDDFVREEIGLALSLPSITVIPVIVNNASPPPEDQLPRKLRDLAMRNAVFVRDGTDYERDIQRLIREIEKAIPTRRISPVLLGSAALVLVAIVGLFIVLSQQPEADPTEQIEPTPEEIVDPDEAIAAAFTSNTGLEFDTICTDDGVAVNGYTGQIAFQRQTQKGVQDDPNTEDNEFVDDLRDIVMIDLSDCSERKLTNSSSKDDENPVWMADGERLVLNSDERKDSEMLILNTRTNQFSDPICCGWNPGVSPQTDRDIIYFEKTGNNTANIHRIDLTQDALEAENVTNSTYREFGASVSPSGRFIVFSRHDDSGRADIWIRDMLSDTEPKEVNLTNSADIHDVHASFSPDGTKILFANDANNGDYEVWVMDVDGNDPTNLTNDSDRWNSVPTWSADGNQIVYVTYICSCEEDDDPSNWDLFIMNADGSDKKRIINTPENEGHPNWRPGS